MCGIAGYLGQTERAPLREMLNKIAHRGPDAEDQWHSPDNTVHLGHRRLSIVDLTSGDQPMRTQDGRYIVVFNGEIYNHRELRRTLEQQGAKFLSDHSDTEVLLHGYAAWGTRLPEHLNGMWAFVLYDTVSRTVFASRDRFGEKPFYYTWDGNTFVFASELSALSAHPAVDQSLSPLAIRKYFAYGYVPGALSMFRGAHKLQAGHNLVLAAGALTVRKYWDFVVEPHYGRSEASLAEELRGHLATAVKRRLMADVPLGVFLSGGIDSSAVTAFATQASDNVSTFSIAFNEASFDESQYARLVANRFHTQHHVETLSAQGTNAIIPDIMAVLDEPMADPSLIPTSLLCRFARQHVKVALGGDGGDELFAGYDPFLALRSAEIYQRFVPAPVHTALALLINRLPVSHRNMSIDFKLKRVFRGLSQPSRLWLPTWMGTASEAELAEMFTDHMPLEEIYFEAIEAWESCTQTNVVDKTMQYFTKLYLTDDILTKVDRAAMMHGLEVRAVFLDNDVVDFARRLPWQMKLRGGQTKYLLKKALEPILPKEILYRRKKGFGVPIGEWIREGKVSFEPTELSQYVNSELFHREIAAHKQGRRDQRMLLWSAWVFNEFIKKQNKSAQRLRRVGA